MYILYSLFLLIGLSCFFYISGIYAAVGLGTKFATVVLEKVIPGGVYNIRELKNLPLIVTNTGDDVTDAIVEPEVPVTEELKPGYEPIPDPGWIKIVPNRSTLHPGESLTCDVILYIPKDKKVDGNNLVGRHFQAKLSAHTVGDGMFGAGVVNRIFFSVGVPGPEAVQKAKQTQMLTSLDFSIDPDKIYLTVPLGKQVNVKKEFNKSIKLVNKGDDNLTVKVESVANELKVPIPPGYEFTPEPNIITLNPVKLKIRKRTVQEVDLKVDVPDKSEWKGKKYLFLVKTTVLNLSVPIELYTQVLVNVN